MKTVSTKAGAGSAPGDLARLSATDMLEGYRRGVFDPVDVIDDTISALEAVDSSCNIMVADLFDTARSAAEKSARAYRTGEAGPMEGVPVSIKDLVFVAGAPAKGGAPSLAGHVAGVDAHVVSKLKNAGAIPTCKTTTCESGYKLTADSPVSGITRNPWNPERTSGGSSGGAAAGVAAGAGPVAIGTDGVGSIRVPSSFCGVFGLKPTYGLVSRAPGFFPPSWGTLAHTGPIARTVADAELTLKTIAGYDVRDAASLDCWAPGRETGGSGPLRVAVSPDFGYAAVDPAVAAAFKAAVDKLLAADFRADDTVLELDPDILARVLKPIALTEQAASIGDRTDADFTDSDEDFRDVIEAGRQYSGVDYMAAMHRRSKLRGQFVEFFKSADILLTPTVAVPAFRAGTLGVSEIDGRPVDGHLGWSPFTWPINLVGLPAASVPCGYTPDGLPVGLQVIASWGQEARIFQVARALERLLPWEASCPVLR
ncbi:amidase family protein [Labrenzia sp. 011]|uniref:amidase n=1 Tax=Labrenzia sp. 011 TaxID=2171494 RepID=UPI000D508295|nr:amidase family protein [Labrenzia sp. 011]PVB59667.1 amidase [Labrenzia sp. 011]